jgi:hypothetical protein
MTTPEPEAAPDPSLYDELSEPAPVSAASGETALTATKETIDNDTEDIPVDDVLDL